MKRHSLTVGIALLLAWPCVSRATTVNFYLQVNVVNHTWSLSASTDSPGGIAGFVVDLENVETGTSVAPRGYDEDFFLRGYRVGNDFWQHPYDLYHQAFAAQFPLELDSLVYGIGYAPVPNTAFGKDGQEPVSMIGDATAVPTLLYTGTYDPVGALPDYRSIQSDYAAIVYVEPPPEGYEPPVLPDEIQYFADTINYNLSIVPEPKSWLFMAMGLLFVAILYRQKLRRQCIVA